MEQKVEQRHAQTIKVIEERDPYAESKELAAIRAELVSLNRVITRAIEHSNRQQMNMMRLDIKEDLSRPMLNYMLNDTRESLDGMNPECTMRGECRTAFESLLQDMVLHLLDDNIDENVLTQYRQRFEELKKCAITDDCNSCINHALRIFNKQMDLLQSVSSRKEVKSKDLEAASTATLPEDVVNSICEPLANKQRLLILKSLVTETKSFSELSKITGLRGGNLLFHIQKLLDTAMILQMNERGDYMITSKGQTTLQGIADLYSKIEKE